MQFQFANWVRVGQAKRFGMRATLCGESYCLPSACRDAPLGQRQGGVFRLPPPYLWTPPTPQCNNCDRRQRRKQGAVVGAAASKTRVPPKARSGCWVPQPVAKGCSPLTILKKKSKHKKASAAPVGAIALTLFSLSPFIAPQSLRDSSPMGERAPTRSAALSQKAALQMPFAATTPPVKMRLERSAERDKREI